MGDSSKRKEVDYGLGRLDVVLVFLNPDRATEGAFLERVGEIVNVAEVVTSFARAYNAVTGRGRIERFCEQLGWDIDGRDGDVLTLNFKCPLIGARPVYVSSGDEPLVLFWSSSLAVFPQDRVPDYVIGYALFRNSKTALGKWQASFNKNDDVFFSHTYTALGEGLNAAGLKYICSGLATEASEFDAKMQEKGYLR